MMDLLSDITIIIPTANRPENISMQQQFWGERPCRVLILDGSAPEKQSKSRYNNINIFHELAFRDRLLIARDKIETKYCMWLGDDDLVLWSKFVQAYFKLLNSNDFEAIYSPPREFNAHSIYRKSGHPEWQKRYSTLEDSGVNRLRKYQECPIDRHFYAIQETECFNKSVLTIIPKKVYITDKQWHYLFPNIFDFCQTYEMRTKADDSCWYLKGISGLRSRNEIQGIDESTKDFSLSNRVILKWCQEAIDYLDLSCEEKNIVGAMLLECLKNKIERDFATKIGQEKRVNIIAIHLRYRKNSTDSSLIRRLYASVYFLGRISYRIFAFISKPRFPLLFALTSRDLQYVRHSLSSRRNFLRYAVDK